MAWATCLLSTKATNTACILGILAFLCMLTCQASPMTTQHIAGKLNTMADLASYFFTTHPDPCAFPTNFHSSFPLSAAFQMQHSASLIDTVNADIQAGVALTLKTQQHHWHHWLHFLPATVNPYLQNVDQPTQLLLLQIIAKQIWQGDFGQGLQVKTSSIQTALGAIGKIIKLANYYVTLTLQTKTFCHSDPVVNRQLAVPINVPSHLFLALQTSSDCCKKQLAS